MLRDVRRGHRTARVTARTTDDGWPTLTAEQLLARLAKALTDSEAQIVAELKTVQGKAVDIGGYYKADAEKCKAVMRPSPTLNAALRAARA